MQLSELRPRFTIGRRLAACAVAGTALVVPLALLEWRAGGGFPTGVPVALFVTLWIVAVAACLLAWPAVRGLASADADRRALLRSGIAVAGALLLAWFWISLVRDQWPCFMGVPNCD